MPHPHNKLRPSRAGNKPEVCQRREFIPHTNFEVFLFSSEQLLRASSYSMQNTRPVFWVKPREPFSFARTLRFVLSPPPLLNGTQRPREAKQIGRAHV